MRHRQSKSKDHLCSGKTLRFPRLNALPKIRAPHSPYQASGARNDAVLYHHIIEKRHGKNKVNSMRYCVRVECNGFAAARLKTPQFRQGFDTTCPSDLSRIRRDRYFKAHVIKRIHLCDSGGIMRDVRAGILPRGALHLSYWNHSEATCCLSTAGSPQILTVNIMGLELRTARRSAAIQ